MLFGTYVQVSDGVCLYDGVHLLFISVILCAQVCIATTAKTFWYSFVCVPCLFGHVCTEVVWSTSGCGCAIMPVSVCQSEPVHVSMHHCVCVLVCISSVCPCEVSLACVCVYLGV